MTQGPIDPPGVTSPGHERGWLVRLLMIAAALLFIGAASLLYFRWLYNQEHSTILILKGTDALEGATATVNGVNLRAPIAADFLPDNAYTLRFFLEPGSYSFNVKRDGIVLDSPEEFSLPAKTMLTFNLARRHPSTRGVHPSISDE